MTPEPLFILAPPRSFTSLVSTVVGQHPAAYGLPELNLFMAADMGHFWDGTDADGSRKAAHWPIMRHGLLRTLAQLYAGEQNIDSIQMAYRWIIARRGRDTGSVFHELCDKISPLITVEKSPGYLGKPVYLQRMLEAFPNARFMHLLRHPAGQGESLLKAKGGKLILTLMDSVDYVGDQRVPDPQILWHDANIEVLQFLEQVPAQNRLQVRGEDFIRDMDAELKRVCDWLGLASGSAELAAMKHPEDSPFAHVGPVNARLGNDINFLESPAIRPARVQDYDLAAPLSWRPDGQPLRPEVVALAHEFGYQ